MVDRNNRSRLVVLVGALATSTAAAQTGALGGEWRAYGGDNAASRYSPLDQTGAVLAEIRLPTGATGAPMTYMHRGKQYVVVVVAVGGREHEPEWIALSLP
jgi:glucose dehydrogenase